MTSWEKFCTDWKGKNVLVMGLGLQGRGIGGARVFCQAGANVTVTDLKSDQQLQPALKKLKNLPIKYALGNHREEDFRSHDMVLRNPDVPRTSQFLKVARESGIPIMMDSSLFAKYCQLPIIGITGTRGKTTTTMMIYEILKKLYPGTVYLGGNIPGKATLELLNEVQEGTRMYKNVQEGITVLELSSWELQGWDDEKISPNIVVFTNLYEDHLNRYKSMDDYFQDKLAVLRYQNKTDWAILNSTNPWTKKAARETKARIKWFNAADLADDISLEVPGGHNRANAAAALAVAASLELDKEKTLGILAKFKGVPSRLETIATIDGVEYINDTTSTTPAAGIAALAAIKKPIVLIAGGSSKKLDLRLFAKEIVRRVKHVIFLKGDGTDEILKSLGRDDRIVFDDFQMAIDRARQLAKPGDVVLLSPGCASFSMFKNEFDRGDQFNQVVLGWQPKKV